MRENKKLNKINYKCTIPNIKNLESLDYYEDLILIKKILYLLDKNCKIKYSKPN